MAEVEERIKQLIREQGRITFAQFMDMALYYPGLGYYSSPKERIGGEGDYYTSPSAHPAFAALLCLQLEEMWQLLGSPADFTVVEFGAGSGLLAQDILAYLPCLNPELTQALTYVAKERERSWVVHGHEERAKPPQGLTGCLLSNEFFDALPTHRVRMQGGRLRELYVTLDGERLVEVVDAPSTPLLEQRLAKEGISLPEGYTTEVNLALDSWIDEFSRLLRRGFVLTIDYGYQAQELYSAQRQEGTLTTHHQHIWGTNPYRGVGERDISSHADFTAIIARGEEQDLGCWGLISQRRFLLNLGLDILVELLGERGLSPFQIMSNRYTMMELINPQGLGKFGVLIQGKGLPQTPLWGLTSNSPKKQELRARKSQLPLPLLGQGHTPLLQGRYPNYAFIDPEALLPPDQAG